jgi:two-component system, OmpR family, phosphate regulon response regulator PhoB
MLYSATVVIVENDPVLARLIALHVERAGGAPLVTRNGEQALESARVCLPAVMITALKMPHIDAAALVRALRVTAAARGWSMPAIILITASDSRYALEIGADALLPMPVNLTDLDALLHRYIG